VPEGESIRENKNTRESDDDDVGKVHDEEGKSEEEDEPGNNFVRMYLRIARNDETLVEILDWQRYCSVNRPQWTHSGLFLVGNALNIVIFGHSADIYKAVCSGKA
jgi:hypothetical protein